MLSTNKGLHNSPMGTTIKDLEDIVIRMDLFKKKKDFVQEFYGLVGTGNWFIESSGPVFQFDPDVIFIPLYDIRQEYKNLAWEKTDNKISSLKDRHQMVQNQLCDWMMEALYLEFWDSDLPSVDIEFHKFGKEYADDFGKMEDLVPYRIYNSKDIVNFKPNRK